MSLTNMVWLIGLRASGLKGGMNMKKVKVICPKCGNVMIYKNYFDWTFRTLIHWFNFLEWRDYCRTKCSNCGEISYIRREK